MGDRSKYPMALPEGTAIGGQYIIGDVLGQGGFGITYTAEDYQTKQKVAIKEYFPDGMAIRSGKNQITPLSGEREENYRYGMECFLLEAKTLSEFLNTPEIVRVLKYFEENGTAYLCMEYVEGESFDEYLKEKGGHISFEDAKRCLIPVMDALSKVHEKGIIHRDISPDNIFITDSGQIKLLDFGSARYSLGDRSKSLDVILKPGFAPKEQYTRRGRQGFYTDVYSLAATMYFALTGERPPDSIERLDEDTLIPPSQKGVAIPPEAEAALLKGLSVSVHARYQTAAEFKAGILGEVPVENYVNQIPIVKSGELETTGLNVPDAVGNTAGMQGAVGNTAGVQGITGNTTGMQGAMGNTAGIQGTAGNTAGMQGVTGNTAGMQGAAGNARNSKSSTPKWLIPLLAGAGVFALLIIIGAVTLISRLLKKEVPAEPTGNQVAESEAGPVYQAPEGGDFLEGVAEGGAAAGGAAGGLVTASGSMQHYEDAERGFSLDYPNGVDLYTLKNPDLVAITNATGDKMTYYVIAGYIFRTGSDLGSALPEPGTVSFGTGDAAVYSAYDFNNMISDEGAEFLNHWLDGADEKIVINDVKEGSLNGQDAYLIDMGDMRKMYIVQGKGDFGCYVVYYRVDKNAGNAQDLKKICEDIADSFTVSGSYQEDGYDMYGSKEAGIRFLLSGQSLKGGAVENYGDHIAIYPVKDVYDKYYCTIWKSPYDSSDDLEKVCQASISSTLEGAEEYNYTSDCVPNTYGRYKSWAVEADYRVSGESYHITGAPVLADSDYWRCNIISTPEYVGNGGGSALFNDLMMSFCVDTASTIDTAGINGDDVISTANWAIGQGGLADDGYDPYADYIFPYSDINKLTDSDIKGMDAMVLCYARNEIFARHGRKFTSRELQEYFNGCAWYAPLYEPNEFGIGDLSEVEKYNVNFLQEKEKKLGQYIPK